MPRSLKQDESELDKWNWLLERAEEAAAAGLPLDVALQAVRDGYSSHEADGLKDD